MAATTMLTSLRQWHLTKPNPYPTRSTIFESFTPSNIGGAGTPAPATLRTMADSTTHPLTFMFSSTENKPIIALMPFLGGLAGTPIQDKHILLGDVTPNGQLPTIIKMPAEFFYLANVNVNCVAITGMHAAWAADPNATVLPSNAQVAADGSIEAVTCRKSVPVPHELVPELIQRQNAGSLSWRSIWLDILVPQILPDPQKVLDYAHFLEFAQVASTSKHQANPPGDLDPVTNLDLNIELTPESIRDQALQRLQMFLPGLVVPQGIGAQVHQLHQQFVQAQAQQAVNNAPTPPSTLLSTNRPLHNMIQLLSDADEPDFGAYWSTHIGRRAGEYLSLMTVALSTVGRALNIAVPILSPALAADLGIGQWISMDLRDICTGISIFRFRTALSITAAAARERNYVYNMVGQGAGIVHMNATHLVLANNEVDPPRGLAQFTQYIEVYYCFLVCFFGENSVLVISFRDHLFARLRHIETWLGQSYREPAELAGAFLTIMVFIWRVTNRYVTTRLATPLGTAVRPPPYGDIEEYLELGRLGTLTEIPHGLLVPAAPPTRGGAGNGGTNNRNNGGNQNNNNNNNNNNGGNNNNNNNNGGNNNNNNGSTRVENPNQNVNLKRAWAAQGITHVYRPPSPFYDTTCAHDKKIVPADAPDTRRICLPMGLTGVCYSNCSGKHEALSPAEVQRVAQAGGFTVN